MATAPEFSSDRIQQALDAAASHNESKGLQAAGHGHGNLLAGGEFSLLAECISVSVQNGKICLNLPLGIGSVCLPIPSWIPDGTAAQACLSICTTWGIPTGVKVTVSVAGQVIITKTFGKC